MIDIMLMWGVHRHYRSTMPLAKYLFHDSLLRDLAIAYTRYTLEGIGEEVPLTHFPDKLTSLAIFDPQTVFSWLA